MVPKSSKKFYILFKIYITGWGKKIDYPAWLKKHKERQNEKTTLKTNLQMWPFEVIQRTITTLPCVFSRCIPL